MKLQERINELIDTARQTDPNTLERFLLRKGGYELSDVAGMSFDDLCEAWAYESLREKDPDEGYDDV